MPFTISNNTDPTKAQAGEQSAGVLALQKSLNSLGAGLKEDSQYGPLTQAAFAKYGASFGNGSSANIIPTNDQQVQQKNTLADANNGIAPGAGGAASTSVSTAAPAPETPPTNTPAATTTTQNAPVVPGAAPTATEAPAGTSTPTPEAPQPLLQTGSKGPAVASVQSLLGITSDGSFGPQTQAAVKAFQSANGITVDGIVGPETMAAITKAKAGSNPASTVTSGAASTTNPLATVKTGNASVDALIQTLNNQSPQKSFSDVYKEVYTSLGLDTMKTDYENQTQAYSDLQDKKNDEVQDINNNPWYSEGVRENKLKQLDAKYEGKETILTNKLKLLETNITNSRSDAQFISGKIMDQLDQTSKLTDDIILKAIDVAEKQSDAESKLTEVSPGGSLYNPKTGQVEFTAPERSPSTTTITTEQKNTFIQGGSKKLEASRGADGFVDPYVYKEAYDGWVNGFVDSKGVKQPPIGTAAEFASKFPPEKYVNPAASSITNLLPAFLQNKTKSNRSL